MAGLPVKNMWLWSPKHVYKHPNLSLNKPDFFTINWLGEGLRSCEKLVLKLRKNEINKRSSFRESVHLKWKNPQNLKIHKSNRSVSERQWSLFSKEKVPWGQKLPNFISPSRRHRCVSTAAGKGRRKHDYYLFFFFFFLQWLEGIYYNTQGCSQHSPGSFVRRLPAHLSLCSTRLYWCWNDRRKL